MNDGAILASAQNAHKQGQYLEAEQLYLNLLERKFEPEKILCALTNVSILANALDRAQGYLTELIKQNPNNISYCEALAKLYAKSCDWAAVARCYARFIRHNPDNADAYYNHAFNLKLAANYEQAIDNYQLALDKNISHPEDVLTNMAVIYSEQLRLEPKAKECLQLALNKAPDYIPAIFNLATLYEEEGNRLMAAECYQKILNIDPSQHSALVRLAEAQCIESSNDPIIHRLRDAAKVCSQDTPSLISLKYALAKVLDNCGEYDEAFEHYSEGNNLEKDSSRETYSREDQEQLIQDNMSLFTSQWFSKLAPVSDAQPIFICGMFRSGSTLLEQILASHSKVTAGGERDFFVRLEDKTLRPYPLAVGQLTQQALKKIANDYLHDLGQAFPDAQIKTDHSANIVTDKRPDNFLYLGLIKTLFPRAKIIHTQRESLDNCLSIYFLRVAESISYATDLNNIAHFYKQHELLMAHWKSLFGDDIHQLSYDKLVTDPQTQIRAVLDFIGLDWEPDCVNFHRIDNRVKTASVWQVRQPLYQSSSGRWKNYQNHIQSLIELFEI